MHVRCRRLFASLTVHKPRIKEIARSVTLLVQSSVLTDVTRNYRQPHQFEVSSEVCPLTANSRALVDNNFVSCVSAEKSLLSLSRVDHP